MLHKFVAASQAQSRSWKTYMKKKLPSPVAFFGANLLLFAIPSVLHAASPRGRAAPRGYLLSLGNKKALFSGCATAQSRRRVQLDCANIHEREQNLAQRWRPARRVRGRRGTKELSTRRRTGC